MVSELFSDVMELTSSPMQYFKSYMIYYPKRLTKLITNVEIRYLLQKNVTNTVFYLTLGTYSQSLGSICHH